MADGSKIEWTDATWNPITGCSVVSAGCRHCYAMRLAGGRMKHHPSRAGLTLDTKAGPVWTGEVRFNEQWLDQPLNWSRPRDIFVCAHGDLFHEDVPPLWIDRVFAVMARATQHRFQVLTKRSHQMRSYLAGRVADPHGLGHIDGAPAIAWPFANVIVGVSIEDRSTLGRLVDLRATPAHRRFLSLEPLLEDLGLLDLTGIHQVIVGGESGLAARPMHPDWVRSIRDQCAAQDVPFLFKQWGEWAAFQQLGCPPNLCHRGEEWLHIDGERAADIGDDEFDEGFPLHRSPWQLMDLVGRKAAGRRLDGVQHDGVPA